MVLMRRSLFLSHQNFSPRFKFRNLCIHLLFHFLQHCRTTICRVCRSLKALQREPFMAFIVATEEAIVGQDKPFVNPRGFLIAIEFVQGMNGFNPEFEFLQMEIWRTRIPEVTHPELALPIHVAWIVVCETRRFQCLLGFRWFVFVIAIPEFLHAFAKPILAGLTHDVLSC